jgi:FKBP-type peptidyl-prolyl cis-trans isomerase
MRILALAAATVAIVGCGQQAKALGSAALASQEDSVSYIIGLKMGEQMKQQGVELKPEIIARGLAAGMSGSPATMPDSVMQATMLAFQMHMMSQQQHKDSIAGLANEKDGATFLAANKGKEGVKTTASGLQYKVLKEGTGPKPKATSTVTVHYKGTLLDGSQFDSSYDRGEPATFQLNQVIPGWTEGVQLMNVGSKYQFWIPGNLGYGPAGSPPKIGPNAVLVFEVELLAIK